MRKLTDPGRYSGGGNLYLFVKSNGARAWTFRYTLPMRTHGATPSIGHSGGRPSTPRRRPNWQSGRSARSRSGGFMKVLEPIWKAKPETASRLRGRIDAVFDYATARGWRNGENPAWWKSHRANLLPKRSKIAKVQHHAALSWGKAPAFTRGMSAQKGTAALALRFTIQTAARMSEVTGATWGQVDLDAKLWMIPGARQGGSRIPARRPARAKGKADVGLG